ncbi:MAG: RNA polymerase sigma factor [Syntrophobacteraceae bacterium]|jgi:RNA polymerase sigma-70 factor (ECF subfamily)
MAKRIIELKSSGGIEPTIDMEYKLIEAIGTGDTSAFETLINRYRNSVLNFIYRYVGDRYSAEDLAQEVFLRVYSSAAEFEPRGKVSTWIFKIAYNLSLNEISRRKRLCLFADTEEEKEIEIRASNSFAFEELKETLMDYIQRLPEKQKAALLLRINEELSYSEIGNILSTSVSSVESLIFRARENLRKMIGGKQEDNSGSR